MAKPVLRSVLTILMYIGVAVFLAPYVRGTPSTGIPFLIGGAALTVLCGMLRCFLTEGDCTERTIFKAHP